MFAEGGWIPTVPGSQRIKTHEQKVFVWGLGFASEIWVSKVLFLSVNPQSISIFRLEVVCRKEERLRLQEEERFRKEEETRLQKEGGLTWAEKI